MDKWKTFSRFACRFRCPPVVWSFSTTAVHAFSLIMSAKTQLSTICYFGAKLQSLYLFPAEICGKVTKKLFITWWISPPCSHRWDNGGVIHSCFHKLSTRYPQFFLHHAPRKKSLADNLVVSPIVRNFAPEMALKRISTS